MEAELVAVEEANVKVKMAASGRLIEFPIDLLAEEDQGYIRQWAEENKSYRIRIDARKKIKDSEVTKKGDTKISARKYVYTIALNNWGREAVDDATVRYRVYTDTGYKEGEYDLSMLEDKMTETFESFETTLSKSEKVTVSQSGGS
jgi:hypothetical protein